jgi:hypothetical protein
MARRTCKWIWVRNKEPRGCIGCHEDGELTPENRMVKAVTRPSISLTLPPESRRTVVFDRDVAPIVSAKCANGDCHVDRGVRRGSRRELAAYLTRRARTSPLVWHLFGRNTSSPRDRVPPDDAIQAIHPECSAPLTEDERRTIIEWIDLGVQ